jgi:hypothetical protein
LLSNDGQIDFFLLPNELAPVMAGAFSMNERVFEPHRRGKRIANFAANKDCVVRGTFSRFNAVTGFLN